MKNLRKDANWILQHYPKVDIASALALSRNKVRAERDKNVRQENELFEIREALGLMPETCTHKELIDTIRVLIHGEDVEVLEGPADKTE